MLLNNFLINRSLEIVINSEKCDFYEDDYDTTMPFKLGNMS
jgi:hypothetical protein